MPGPGVNGKAFPRTPRSVAATAVVLLAACLAAASASAQPVDQFHQGVAAYVGTNHETHMETALTGDQRRG